MCRFFLFKEFSSSEIFFHSNHHSNSPILLWAEMGQCHNVPDSSVRVTTVTQTPPSSFTSSSFRLTKEQLQMLSSAEDDNDRISSFNAMSMYCGDQAASKYSNSSAVLRRESSDDDDDDGTLTTCSESSDVGSMCSDIESLCIEQQSNVECRVLVIERYRARASMQNFVTSQPILKNDVLASLLWRRSTEQSELRLL